MGKEVAVAFSGGMDSGLVAALAKKYARSVTCYICGTDDSFDVQAGRELAEKLELPWVHCRIGEDTIEGDIRELVQATKVSDPFTISYELQLFTVCRKAHEPVILSGQGSDEYFGGWHVGLYLRINRFLPYDFGIINRFLPYQFLFSNHYFTVDRC